MSYVGIESTLIFPTITFISYIFDGKNKILTIVTSRGGQIAFSLINQNIIYAVGVSKKIKMVKSSKTQKSFKTIEEIVE